MQASTAALALLRGAHLLALLLSLGTLVTLVTVAPRASSGSDTAIRRARQRLLHLARLAAAAALVTGCAWLVMQAIAIGSPSGPSQAVSVLWVVVHRTRFGQAVTVRLVCIVLALPLLRRQRWSQIAALGLTLAAVSIQGTVGHVGAVGGTTGDGLVASEALHLMAAGAWLGALPPLLLLLAMLPPRDAAAAYRRFSPIGLSAVLLLIGTALAQAPALIGDIPGLFGTAYGHIALVKIGLFLLLLGLAVTNRFALTARLEGATPGAARRQMGASVAVETALGMAVVLAASFLASGVPALHEQPTWPFAWRPSLAALIDPDLRREVANALIAIGVATAVAVLGLPWRRLRWPALAVAAVVFWLAVPHLNLLLVEAYPTSYYTSPTGFSADSIVRGATLYRANCADCHGTSGRGDGPRAGLPVHPADLTAQHLWEHSDGDLFWWLTDGIDAPEGGMAMPGFVATLSADDRWALIDYMRAHNAGTAMAAGDAWPVPIRAPSVPIDCDGVAGEETGDLRGAVLRVIADASRQMPRLAPVPAQDGVPTIIMRLSPNGTARPAPGECVAATPSAWPAYAVLAGLDPAALGGTEFLVDPASWLRAVWRPDRSGGWATQDRLIAEIRQICTHPIANQEAGTHAHHH
jgi:putative copper export protein/mono/diheme cytochrome c family protein